MADIVTNHKARRDYHILDTFEAGIVLHGTEVKSLRAGKGQIADAFARVEKDEVDETEQSLLEFVRVFTGQRPVIQ